ncbi:hypothetical protein [Lysinibacillus sp. IITD104]|uniref:hypothetical protein n=1 Tax=Lysinibacillus sp. IITD104 TaxID=3116650 RepID=UPI002FD61CAA
MVTTKSEVFVANILDKMEIEYYYEEPLDVSGKTYIPDFTLRYQGKTAYLEHLGMLRNKLNKKHWDKKKANYKRVVI